MKHKHKFNAHYEQPETEVYINGVRYVPAAEIFVNRGLLLQRFVRWFYGPEIDLSIEDIEDRANMLRVYRRGHGDWIPLLTILDDVEKDD